MAASLLATLTNFVRPHIVREVQLRMPVSRQLEIISMVERYDVKATLTQPAPGGLADEMMLLGTASGLMTREDLERESAKNIADGVANPFTGEEMQNTDVTVLHIETEDRLRRHVEGNFLNADKGFRYQVWYHTRETACCEHRLVTPCAVNRLRATPRRRRPRSSSGRPPARWSGRRKRSLRRTSRPNGSSVERE